MHLSFVRSATMDKWKPSELEKMKVGGNRAFNDFLEEHDDFNPSWSIEEKYNSKSAALFRDKVATESRGEVSNLSKFLLCWCSKHKSLRWFSLQPGDFVYSSINLRVYTINFRLGMKLPRRRKTTLCTNLKQ